MVMAARVVIDEINYSEAPPRLPRRGISGPKSRGSTFLRAAVNVLWNFRPLSITALGAATPSWEERGERSTELHVGEDCSSSCVESHLICKCFFGDGARRWR
jgi:hypothetical protein